MVELDSPSITDRTESTDPVLRRSTTDADVGRLIRNTSKVPLTRGTIGTVAYSTDPETRAELRDLVAGRRVGQIEGEHGHRG